jgi:Cof subfamily protein (haloacid dehalogenase superfamily)
MGKFDGILLCSDLDGTLLREDKSISEKNRRALEYFKQNGGLFSIMTGRMSFVLEPTIKETQPNVPVGFGNGLGIYDFQNNRKLSLRFVDPSVLALVEKVYQDFPEIGVEIATHDTIYCVRVNETVKKHLSDENIPLVMTTPKDFSLPIAKILFAAPPEVLENFIPQISKEKDAEKFQLLRSDKLYFEILPPNVGKGELLLQLAELLGVDKKKTIAVGDNDNDVSMLLSAQIGIAVENAAKRAKDAADMFAPSNEDDAIAFIIQELENERIKLG